VALQNAGRHEKAITAYQDAAVIFREVGDGHGEGSALGNLGAVLQENVRLDAAITA
jgi:Tetratricopeptide repeat